jgi:Fanconi anemia group M protein
VERSVKTIYLKLLEKGIAGADIDQLASEMETEGMTISTLRSAIGKLIKEGFVTKRNSGRYVATSTNLAVETHEVKIDKIIPGSAVVIVDGKWRARLMPTEFHGPRALIKKDSKFRASAQLYRVEGTLCIKVKGVTEIL